MSLMATDIGEIMSSVILSSNAVNVSGSTFVTSLSLTWGDWDVSGAVHFLPANTTSLTAFYGSISESTSLDGSPGRCGGMGGVSIIGTGTTSLIATISTHRVSVSSTAPLSGLPETLIAYANFSGSCAAYGFIQARRCGS